MLISGMVRCNVMLLSIQINVIIDESPGGADVQTL